MESVSIPSGSIQFLLGDVIEPRRLESLLTQRRLVGLECTAGIQFLYDRHGNYLDEINAWQIEQATRTPSFHSRATRSSALKAVASWFEDHNLRWQDCTELVHMNLLHQTMRGKDAKISKGTWNQWMHHWLRFVRYAERKDYVEGIGFEAADVLESGQSAPEIRALTPSEFRMFLAAAPTQRMQAGCAAIVGTGLRVAELASLRISQVPNPDHLRHRGRSYLEGRITGKGEKTRTIYWPLQAIKLIKQYIVQERALAVDALIARVTDGQVALAETHLVETKNPVSGERRFHEPEDAPLWLAENGDPLSYHRWGKDFQKTSATLADQGIRCSPHFLRHTFAIAMLSMLIKSQIRQELIEQQLGSPSRRVYFLDPVREVKERLGHASIDTTMIYLDHIAEHRELIAMAISDLQTVYLNG